MERINQAHSNRLARLDARKASLVVVTSLISAFDESHEGEELKPGEVKYIGALRRQQWGLQFNISVTETISKLYK